MKNTLILFVFVSFSIIAFSQTETEKREAYNYAIEAIELMDNGEIDKSIELLEKSCNLDPKNNNYPYELGYAYYLKEDYQKSIQVYEEAVKFKNITDQFYQMLGNAYDMNNQRDEAIDAYTRGLKKFPKSGRLFLELGNVHQDDWNKAIEFYENGIEVDPEFPSNYYWAAKIFCNSTEEMWGMIYGEIFMNIERGSNRTKEISKLLFDTYFSEIQFTSDSSFTISFCQDPLIYPDKTKSLPYGLVYEPTLAFATISEDTITLESLNRIRERFIGFYDDRGFFKTHPNVLIDWHKKLIKENLFECYNYWLLMQGASNEFSNWYNSNQDRFESFINWFQNNSMPISKKNMFLRYNY